MNRIKELFKRKQEDVLNIYFTAGYPNLDSTQKILKNLSKLDVDIVEIGMPYSDPLADGPTIQASGQKALKNGMKLDLLFDQISEARQLSDLPMIMMGYFNQVMQYGEEQFFTKAKDSGVDGFILPDMPLHVYEQEFKTLFEDLDLGISFLISPQTDTERIFKIDELCRGFIYMVSSASITGAKKGISEQQINYFKRIKDLKLKTPRLIGFGISNHETFSKACEYASGAVIGSAFIKALDKENSLEDNIINFISSIRNDKIVSI